MSQDQDFFYDVDRDIIAPHRSPPLVAIKPSYEPEDSPAPQVPIDPSSDSSEGEDTGVAPSSKRRRKRKGRTKPSFADGVLIRAIDPNQGELATHAEKNPLASNSPSEAEEEDHEADLARVRMRRRSNEGIKRVRSKAIVKAALNALHGNRDEDDDWPMIDTPAPLPEDTPSPSTFNPTPKPNSQEQFEPHVGFDRGQRPKRPLNTKPPPLMSELRLDHTPIPERDEDDGDTIVNSPALARFAIAPQSVPQDFILPAMQLKSYARLSPTSPQHHKPTLPSIKTAIGDIHDATFTQFASMSPMSRPSPGYFPPPYASPAPYSAMSPPNIPLQYSSKATTRDSNTSTFSEYTSSATFSTPASSIVMTPSSSAYVLDHDRERPRQDSLPEPIEESSTETEADTPDESPAQPSLLKSVGPPQADPIDAMEESQPVPASAKPLDESQSDDGHPDSPEGSQAETVPAESSDESQDESGSPDPPDDPPDEPTATQPSAPRRFGRSPYRCPHAGCKAAPFQTQYLLNSHMNVHSNTRTHFCPVRGCPRGPGGKGFKRKNEMIRYARW